MRIILFIISFILIAEAGSDVFLDKKNQPLAVFAFEGAAEEELPVEKDNLNTDTQFADNNIYNNNIYRLKQNYYIALKYHLPIISHTIYAPPPEC